MKTLAITAIAATLVLSAQAQAHPQIGPEIRVVSRPAHVTTRTYERVVSAEAGAIPRVQPQPAHSRFANYQEISPQVGYLPPFTRKGDYFSDARRGTEVQGIAQRTGHTEPRLTWR
jgi:hypothetical protein